MKIKCIENNLFTLPSFLAKEFGNFEGHSPLTIGKEYIVFALGEIENTPWFCICDDKYSYFPNWWPSNFFEIIDPRLSRHWIISIEKPNGDTNLLLSFPEWGRNPLYYDELVDGENDEVISIFKKYYELMNLEYPDNLVLNTAEIANDQWVICPLCLDGWESVNILDAMLKCPTCKAKLHNPRYKLYS